MLRAMVGGCVVVVQMKVKRSITTEQPIELTALRPSPSSRTIVDLAIGKDIAERVASVTFVRSTHESLGLYGRSP